MKKDKSILFEVLKKNQVFITKNFVRLNLSFVKTKNYSFVLAKKNDSFFYKVDKIYLFLVEICIFFLSFFERKNKALLFSDEKIFFYLSKNSFLRSFQNIFFGFFKSGFFINDSITKKKFQSFFKTIDIFFLLPVKNHAFILKEINFFYKPIILFLEKNIFENFLFYRIFSEKGLFFFYYVILKMISDFVIKTQIYNYVIVKSQKSFPLDF